MKLIWIGLLVPALTWAWGAPQPPPHAIDLKVKSMPDNTSPKFAEPPKERSKPAPPPEEDGYRFDVPDHKKKSK